MIPFVSKNFVSLKIVDNPNLSNLGKDKGKVQGIYVERYSRKDMEKINTISFPPKQHPIFFSQFAHLSYGFRLDGVKHNGFYMGIMVEYEPIGFFMDVDPEINPLAKPSKFKISSGPLDK